MRSDRKKFVFFFIGSARVPVVKEKSLKFGRWLSKK